MKQYLIGRMSESSLDRLQNLLDDTTIVYHRFFFNLIERRGRPRVRMIIERPVFPGLIFIPKLDRELADKLARSFDKNISWMTNTASDSGLASCSTSELEPIFRWVERMNVTASMKMASQTPRRGPKIEIGQEVVVELGPFAGRRATVTETLGKQVKVELQKSELSLIIASCNLAPA